MAGVTMERETKQAQRDKTNLSKSNLFVINRSGVRPSPVASSSGATTYDSTPPDLFPPSHTDKLDTRLGGVTTPAILDDPAQLKTCSQCFRAKPHNQYYTEKNGRDGLRANCKACHKDVARAWRENNPEKWIESSIASARRSRQRRPHVFRARMAVSNAIRRGRLTRQPCSVCGTTVDVHAHHPDYNKPLEVDWLCRAHHTAWHIDKEAME